MSKNNKEQEAPVVFCTATSCIHNDKSNHCRAKKINVCAINNENNTEEADCLTYMPEDS